MQVTFALEKVWMRALVAGALYLVLVVGLFVGGASIGEHGPDWIARVVFSVIAGVTVVGLVIAPAWVFQPRATRDVRARPPDGGGFLPSQHA